MAVKPTSVRLDEDLLARLDKLAEAYDRSRGWLIAEAVRRFIEDEEQLNAQLDEGIRAADDGHVVPHEQVVAEMEELIASFHGVKAAE